MKKISILLFVVIIVLTGCSEVSWGYDTNNGPDKWSEISEENGLCGSGESQSPINITEENVSVSTDSKLELNYSDSEFKVIDTGHSLEFEAESEDDFIMYNDTKYTLKQIHFHNESEHTINDKHYPLEGHFVHENADGNNLVISVMFDLGETNKVIGDNFSDENIDSTIEFSPKELLLDENENLTDYTSYVGSLTTPPCTEGVQWVISQDVREINQTQLDDYKAHYTANNRPTQEINDRVINTTK